MIRTPKKRKPGRPPKHDYDIMKQQGTMGATPEEVAKAVISSPPKPTS